MMQAITYTTLRKLPEVKVNTTNVVQLELAVEHWQGMYSEAGEQKEKAWCMYQDAIDQGLPRATIDDLFAMAQLFEDICKDTWHKWQDTKRQLLELSN